MKRTLLVCALGVFTMTACKHVYYKDSDNKKDSTGTPFVPGGNSYDPNDTTVKMDSSAAKIHTNDSVKTKAVVHFCKGICRCRYKKQKNGQEKSHKALPT